MVFFGQDNIMKRGNEMVGRKRAKVNAEFLIDAECSMHRYLHILGIFIHAEPARHITRLFATPCTPHNLDLSAATSLWIFYPPLVGAKREKKTTAHRQDLRAGCPPFFLAVALLVRPTIPSQACQKSTDTLQPLRTTQTLTTT